MSAHIPGPYVFDLDDGSVQAEESGMVLAEVPAVDNFPCRDTEKDEEFEAELVATGRLFAAAPDLLDVAKCLRQHLALFCGPDDAIANEIFAISDAAIAKAEGRQHD